MNPTNVVRTVVWLAVAGLVVVFGSRLLGSSVRKAGL